MGARAKGSTDGRRERGAGLGPDASVMMDGGVGEARAANPPFVRAHSVMKRIRLLVRW